MQKKLNLEILCFGLPISAYLNDLTKGEKEKTRMLNHFQIIGIKSTFCHKYLCRIYFIHLLRVLFWFCFVYFLKTDRLIAHILTA